MSAPANGIGVDERLMRRRWWLAGALGLTALLIVGRAVQLQGFQGDRWRGEAERQQQTRVPVPARRGAIYDRDGVALALTRETFAVSIAPREVRDRGDAVLRLTRALGLPRAEARRATDPQRAWVVLPGRFTVEQRRGLGELRGFYVERRLERFYPQGDVGREVLGGVSGDGRAMGGIEQAMDSLLRGTDGFSVLRRDAHGRKEATLSLPALPPRDGDDVVLSIDFDLQEIADAALAEQVRATHAAGGDLILTDPRTGEILAAVSKRPASRDLSAFIEPYEPGSTLKPFFVAGLLAGGRAALTDRVYAEQGSWTTPEGRVIQDVHPYEWLTLRDGLRVSSNIVMAKFSPRLPPGEQYGALRDFGFGTATGVEYPVESSGRLSRPARWSPVTPASLAMGYEVSVTPLQMAMAYGAIANGGVLMEPRLVREVRGADGGAVERRAPRPVRRAIPAQVASALRDVLVDVVADGTGTHASLSTFEVAGKTGTSRRTGANGRYEAGAYNSTFVGFFPAQAPQLVIYVKLDRPQGDYYGGLTAAPVTRATLQAILAARSPTLDRRALLGSRTHPEPSAALAVAVPADVPAAEGREGTYVFLDNRAPPTTPRRDAGPVPVPALAGLALRDGARRLHALGFHVRLQGGGAVKGTLPGAGAILARGDTLTLVGEGS
ncbi:MAG TPA: penicillin-binding transpeptidase domain-containing protein [Longimicrobium sp.]|jgi:cell division protein FtsI (penicillin-binding protein 3)|nr:penicillin-binding transpeptidase domain-containing protein [Longimicrobium sp.]